jgi:predicted outer membrane repeat protein
VILLAVVFLVQGSGVWIVEYQYQRPATVTKFDSIDHLIHSILNKSVSIQSHSSIRFSPGEHLVTTPLTQALKISSVSNLSILVGNPNFTHGLVARAVCQAKCTFGISFLSVHDLYISGISFERCGAPSRLTLGIGEVVNTVVEANVSSNVVFDHVSITGSPGIGLLLLNARMNLSLSNLSLSDNLLNCYIEHEHIGQPECFDHRKLSAENTSIYLLDSVFSFGKSCSDTTICNSSASGLTLVFNQFLYKVELHVNNVTLQDNSGGNIVLNSTSCSRAWLLNFSNVNSVFSEMYLSEQNSYGLRYNEIQCSCKAPISRHIFVSLSIFNQSCFYAELQDNLGLAAGVTYTTVYLKHTIISRSNCASALELRSINSVVLESVEVSYNTGPFSLRIVNRLRLEKRYYNITLCGSCTFRNNKGGVRVRGDYIRFLRSTHLNFAENSTTVISENTVPDQISKQYGATVYISDAVVEFSEGSHTEFISNQAVLSGGITAVRSQIWFTDDSTLVFIGNIGYYGGAVGLYEKSEFMFYQSNATIEFRNNSARVYGGGLYIDDSSYLERISNQYKAPFFSLYCCFPSLNFYNNTAVLGGSAIYGGWIDWVNDRYLFLVEHNISQYIHIIPRKGDLSPIASKPTRVCVCSQFGKPNCSIPASTQKREIYHGETLKISVVAIGQKNGTVASTVVATFVNTTENPRLEPLERIQIVEQNCTQLSYTPMSSKSNETLKLTVSNRQLLRFADKTIKDLLKNPKYKLQFTDLHLDILFKHCPFGFNLNKSAGLCTCPPLSLSSRFDVYCKPRQHQLFRKEITWVGVYNVSTIKNTRPLLAHSSGMVAIFGLCPFDYCKTNETAVTLTTLDGQCNFNRSGILCGGCQGNLSRVFGSFSCKNCSGTQTVPVVIGCVFGGVALVALLFVLNLTISVGTINALIFYANIAKSVHIASFLPQQFCSSFLYKFISVLNMDTGTESCFYDGMTTYTLSWILFIFPFYIWLLSAIIIGVSHYSSRISRWFGGNAVQVLATLFLLSYARLLEITIATSAFSFTTLSSVDGQVQRVWRIDGNLPYMGKKHAPLFAATMLLLILVCIPYTVNLTLVQWLQRYSHKRFLRWMLKLKPFIDAHTGPYKDKHRYWPGFLLLVRAGTFFLFALNSQNNQRVNAALVTVVTICLIFYLLFIRGVYKSRILNIIEVAFLLDLCALSISSFFQEILYKPNLNFSLCITYISVGIAFVYTCLLLVYHAAVRISTTSLGRWIKGIIMPLLSSTVKKKINYGKLVGPVVSDSEYESSTEARSPLSIDRRVTHSSIAIRENEPFLSDTY